MGRGTESLEVGVVMAYILAVLVVLLKVVGIILAAGVGLVVLLVSLPITARVSGSASASGLLEAVVDDDATVAVRVAGTSPATLSTMEDEEGVVPVDVDFAVKATVLAGAAGLSLTGGSKPEVFFLGLRFHLRSKAPKAGETAKGRKAPKDGKTGGTSKAGQGRKARIVKQGRITLRKIREYLAPEVRVKTWAFIRSLFRALHLKGSLDIECGFPDPGNTAMVLGGYWALGGPSSFRGITFRPNFREEVFDVEGAGELRLIPVEIGWIAARYLLSREIRPLWRKGKAGRTRGTEADRSIGAVSAD
ncbi:MAG: DUF2953 domain-containing protein [Bacillota bacterium]